MDPFDEHNPDLAFRVASNFPAKTGLNNQILVNSDSSGIFKCSRQNDGECHDDRAGIQLTHKQTKRAHNGCLVLRSGRKSGFQSRGDSRVFYWPDGSLNLGCPIHFASS